MPEDERKKDDAQESVIKNQEREETEPQAQTVNWAWSFNFKKLLEDREHFLNEQTTQDMTRRNMTNSLVDKLDNIFAVNLAENLSIERQDRQARLEAERQDLKTKDLLFNNSHYYQMNWLYEFTDLALIDYLKNLSKDVEDLKVKINTGKATTT